MRKPAERDLSLRKAIGETASCSSSSVVGTVGSTPFSGGRITLSSVSTFALVAMLDEEMRSFPSESRTFWNDSLNAHGVRTQGPNVGVENASVPRPVSRLMRATSVRR